MYNTRKYKRRRVTARVPRTTNRYRRMSLLPSQRGYFRKSGKYGKYLGAGAVGANGIGAGPELKWADGLSSMVPSNTGVTASMLGIPQGTNEDERIGNKITVKKAFFRFTASFTPTTGLPPVALRVMIVWDKQANGAQAVPGDVLNLGGGTFHQDAFNNTDNSDRFRILKDFRFCMNTLSQNGTTGTSCDKTWDWYIPLNLPVYYGGVTGAITEVKSNNIFVLALSDHNTSDVALRCVHRIRWTDL